MNIIRRTLLFALATLPLAAASSGALNDSERSYLIEQLTKSKEKFLASIAGLSDAQWRYKPAPNVWSVAECSEHIILSEEFIFGLSQQLLKTPAVDRLASATPEADRKIVAAVEDRSHKATAPEPIVPSGKYNTPADAAAEFTKRRDKTIAYVRGTSDDLRVHVTKESPLGPADAYQILLLLASHSTRHTAQLLEVKANASYPAAKMQFLIHYTLARATMADLTPGEMAKMGEHGQYLMKSFQAGVLSWGGRVTDPTHPGGVGMVEVASEAEARAFTASDPAVQAGLLKVTVLPFQEAFRAKR